MVRCDAGQAAENLGEPDALLPYNIANALDALKRLEEAAPGYERFLRSSLCTQDLPDGRCETAHKRLKDIKKESVR